MRIPLQITPKGQQNADETGGKVLGFIHFAEHAKENITNGMEKTIQKFAVFAKENAKLLRNRKNAVTM